MRAEPLRTLLINASKVQLNMFAFLMLVIRHVVTLAIRIN